MKNLLVVAPYSSTFVIKPLKYLSKYFDNIYVVIPTYFGRNIVDKSIKFKNHSDGKIHYFYPYILYVPTKFGFMLNSYQMYYATKRVINQNQLKFDYAIGHFIPQAGYVITKLKEDYKIKTLVYAHGFDVYDFPFRSEKNKKLIQQVLTKSDNVITVSDKNKEILKSFCQNITSKLTIVNNGFDSDLFKIKNKLDCRIKLNLPLDKKIILNVGRLVPIKNQMYFIDALVKLRLERNDFIGIIIGDGPLYKKLKTKINLLNANEYLHLVGSIDYSELPLWYNASDVFVLTSKNEGDPTVVYEALACGLPVITTKVGGLYKLINNKIGFCKNYNLDKELSVDINTILSSNINRDNCAKIVKNQKYDKLSKVIIDILVI